MAAQFTRTASLEATAAQDRVVSEIVAVELADTIEELFQKLDDVLGADGLVSDQAVARALAPFGLSDVWLRDWCGRPAPYLVVDETAGRLDRPERS